MLFKLLFLFFRHTGHFRHHHHLTFWIFSATRARDLWLTALFPQKSNVEAESNCVTSNLGWRDFKYAVASLIIMFGILGTHGAIVLLYFFPCMGLMRRDNQAQAAQRSKLKDSYGQNHQHQRHTTSYGLEMRSRVTFQRKRVGERPMEWVTDNVNEWDSVQVRELMNEWE